EVRKSLNRLSMFKYVDINHKVTGPGELSSHIRVSLLDRYQLSNEFGLQVAQSLPLPFYKLSLQSRNFWGKLELMSLAAHVHTEGVVTLTDEHTLVNSKAWGIDWSLSFPHFLLPLKKKAYAALETLRPTTKLLLGYDFVHRPEYIQHTFKTFINYTWQDRGVGNYVLTPLQIDLINTMNVSEAFHKRLEKLKTEGNNLYRTFNPSWVSHAAFRAVFCARPEDANKPLPYSHLQLYLETGGLLQNLFDLRKITRGLEYYQYVKFEVDYGQHIPLFFNTLLAYRFNFGIALPYGICKVLPYNRYYFAGGASGIRAWLPRTLGPGTYAAPPRPDKQLPLEEPGELLVQGSTELRQPLFGVLEGALFVDAGNVWMLQDDGRAGGQFRWKDAYKTIAVGIGVGARLNFSFLIVRLDAGIKLYDPARRTGQPPSNQSRIVYSLGVGYPY
ncbi:MAG: BamA/TamA family outer membrane protein, partial [Bacteroidota bacterium]